MVPLIPPAFAARDMLLAAGLGFLLALGYRALRCVLGGGRAALFVCDCLAGLAGGVLLRSAAGLAALFALSQVGGLVGITLGVNVVNALVIGVLGVPGFGLLLMLSWALR